MSDLDTLAANPANPRAAWRPEQLVAFTASLQRFGDLGGIVLNRATGQLVGGHKRIEVFRTATDARVEATPQERDSQGTVAHGYVVVEGTRFSYREVEWDLATETAANLAANRWAADWEWAKVSEALQQIAASDRDLLAITGFETHELDTLLAADWNPAAKGALPGDEGALTLHGVKLTAEQYAIVQRARAAILAGEGAETSDTLTDGRVIELVCADFLSGVEANEPA
jgi:hypothetical protein